MLPQKDKSRISAAPSVEMPGCLICKKGASSRSYGAARPLFVRQERGYEAPQFQGRFRFCPLQLIMLGPIPVTPPGYGGGVYAHRSFYRIIAGALSGVQDYLGPCF
jgi:hypothetical protein